MFSAFSCRCLGLQYARLHVIPSHYVPSRSIPYSSIPFHSIWNAKSQSSTRIHNKQHSHHIRRHPRQFHSSPFPVRAVRARNIIARNIRARNIRARNKSKRTRSKHEAQRRKEREKTTKPTVRAGNNKKEEQARGTNKKICLLYTSPSPRD